MIWEYGEAVLRDFELVLSCIVVQGRAMYREAQNT